MLNCLHAQDAGRQHADRAAARAMLRATGWKEDDFRKPIIVVCVTHTNATPCNAQFRELGDIVAARIEELGGKPFIFGTPVVSDGETTGTYGMNYSLVSRDLIADCIETMYEAYSADAVFTLSGSAAARSVPCALHPVPLILRAAPVPLPALPRSLAHLLPLQLRQNHPGLPDADRPLGRRRNHPLRRLHPTR